MALRGGLEGWAREQGWLLPPRPYLIAWMDAHYQRVSKDEAYPSWAGLTFTLEEWFGEDDEIPRLRRRSAHTPGPQSVVEGGVYACHVLSVAR